MVPRIFIQAEFVLHDEGELGNQVAGMGADDSHTEDAITARWGECFDEAACVAIGDGTIQLTDVVARDLIGDSARNARCGEARSDALPPAHPVQPDPGPIYAVRYRVNGLLAAIFHLRLHHSP